MGPRAWIVIAVILGTTAVSSADTKPAKAGSGKPTGVAEQTGADARTAPGEPVEKDQEPAGETEPIPAHVVGPRKVDLGHNSSIDLPEGFILFERAAAQEISRKQGNTPDSVVA